MTTIIIAIAAVLAALLLAFLPLRFVVDFMARSVIGPVRAFIDRQRDRRAASRTTPDRRTQP